MVGEQGNRTSGTREASVPQSYWWKRIHNLNARSRLQEVSGSLNCAEKFSSLVSCHRGYGSVAFYAVFSLFILTFLYAIWKIVSAHSRSARRLGSSNSTSVAKLNPTAHAPTGYVSTHAWLQKENVLDHFHPSVKSFSPFENESPREKPSPVVFFPPENEERSKISSVTSNNDFPIREHAMLGNPSPTWTLRDRVTEPLYNYYPSAYNTVQPPFNNPPYQTVPYPSVVNPLFPTAPYPTGFNPYLRPPFLRGANDNSNSLNERPGTLSSPLANMPYRYPYYSLPTYKNTLSQGSYDNSYYGDNTMQYPGAAQTSPSPLMSFFKESSDNANKSRHQSTKKRKRKKLRRKIIRHKEKKGNHKQYHSKYNYIEDIEEQNEKKSEKAILTKHRKEKHHGKAAKHLSKKNLKQLNRDRHNVKAPSHAARASHSSRHVRHYKRTRHLKTHYKSLRAKVHKHLRTNSHVKKGTWARYLNHARHENPKIPHHHGRNVHTHHTSHHSRHHNVLDFRRYRLYRQHHSVDEEIHGKWSITRHQVRTCKLIDQFSTRGMVKMTRTKAKNRYLHTLLICRPVKLRIRRVHPRRHSIKLAQLCSKRWYATKGFIIVRKVTNNHEIPRYKVQICEPSYAHAVKLLPAQNKETKVWNISDEVLRKMRTDDAEKIDVKPSSVKHRHKRRHKKKKLKKHTKLNPVRESKRGHKNWKHRKYLSRKHHARKGKKHKTVSVHGYKPKRFEPLRGKQSRRLKKLLEKRKKQHIRKANKASTKKKNTINRPKGENMDSDKAFYGKLLKVLKLAKIYNRKKPNRTQSEDVFDSLEAVLAAQNQNSTRHFPQSNKKPTVERSSVKNNKTRKHHIIHKDPPKNTRNKQENSEDNIEKLLAKILPAVLKSFHGDVKAGDLAVTKVTTKPTPKVTTKPRTTIPKTTPTSQAPPSTTKSSNDNIEKVIKNILPLLLEKTHKTNSDSLHGLKSKPKEKQATTTPTKQSSLLPKKAQEKLGLRSLLSRLGMGNLASDSLSRAILAKTASLTKKPATKPTQRLTVALVKSTVLPKTPVHPAITRPKPTSAVTTIQAPPPLSQPDVVQHPESQPSAQSIPFSAKAPVSPPGLPFIALSTPPATPSSISLPVPPPPSSPGPPPMPASQPALSPQMNGNNVSPYSPPVNSDPYSRSILCFGDSLTSGYYNHGHNFHPYSQRLSQLLNSDGRLKYDVKTSGKVREMAHGSMARRLPQVLGNSSRFDWVIILGGTNDVAHVKNFGDDDSFMNQLISIWKPRIVRDIEVLHEIAHKYGARTVLLTVPETAYEAWPNFKTLWVMRRKLNQDLRDYARRSQGNTVLCDLAVKLQRHSLSLQAQALLWNDHLHLTRYGYDKMAEIIYQCLKPYLSQ